MKGTVRIAIGILMGITFGLPLSAADFVKGEVIVKFKHVSGAYKSAAEESESRAYAVGVDDTMAAVSELKERSDIEYVEPNYIIEAEWTPDDWPYSESQWEDVRLTQAWICSIHTASETGSRSRLLIPGRPEPSRPHGYPHPRL
jgi:hypothetical protein